MKKGWMFGLALLAIAQGAMAQDANKIVQDALNRVTSAKSAKGTVVSSMTFGGTTRTQTLTFVSQSPNKLRATSVDAKSKGGANLMVSDGKNLYTYIAQRHQYTKQAAPPQMNPFGASGIGPMLQQMKQMAVTYKLVKKLNYQGHPVYQVQADLSKAAAKAQNPQQRQMMQNMKLFMYIGQNDHVVYNVSLLQNGKQMLGINVKSLQLNTPVSASLFKFTPPKGATLFTPPPPSLGATPGAPPKK